MGMGLTTRWVGRERKGAKADGTHGTHETNAIPLRVTEVGGGTLIILLAPRF
jgi:hypothetical protein